MIYVACVAIGALITAAIILTLGEPPSWRERELKGKEIRYFDTAVDLAEAVIAGEYIETRKKSFVKAREELLEAEDNL